MNQPEVYACVAFEKQHTNACISGADIVTKITATIGAHWPLLTSLNLHACTQITNFPILSIANLITNIKHLNISDTVLYNCIVMNIVV